MTKTSIIVDSNFIGRGDFDSKRVRLIAERLRFVGAELVIPEVVIWEWAEHAHSTASEVAEGIARLRIKIDAAVCPLPLALDVPTPMEIVASIEREIDDIEGISVWRADLDAAMAALRAQILLDAASAHRTKDGTKTGAADEVLIQCALRKLQSSERVAVASNDRRLRESAKGTNPDIYTLCSQNDLFEWVFDQYPDGQNLAEHVLELVNQEMNGSSKYGTEVMQFALGYELLSASDDLDDLSIQTEVTLCRFDLIEVDQFKPLTKDAAKFGTLDVHVFGDVEVNVWSSDVSGDRTPERYVLTNVRVVIPSMVTFTPEWEPDSIQMTGRARID